jgi:hypothetical protein
MVGAGEWVFSDVGFFPLRCCSPTLPALDSTRLFCSMPKPLIHPSLLFEFAIRLRYWRVPAALPLAAAAKRSGGRGKTAAQAAPLAPAELFPWLDETYRLPDWSAWGGNPSFAQAAAAWSEQGIYFQAVVAGKRRARGKATAGGEPPGSSVQLWIDTRNSPNVHRASRFCHLFRFFPGDPDRGSPGARPAWGSLGEIPRAREHPQPVRPEELQVQSSFAADGYRLQAFLPAKCLTGYLPQEFDRIRLFYEVADEELGQQPQSLASGYRYNEDPSLWVETHLDRESS